MICIAKNIRKPIIKKSENKNSAEIENPSEMENENFMGTLNTLYEQERIFQTALKSMSESMGDSYHKILRDFTNLLNKYTKSSNATMAAPRPEKFPVNFSFQYYKIDGNQSIMNGLNDQALNVSNLKNVYYLGESQKMDEFLSNSLQIFSNAYKKALRKVMKKIGMPAQDAFKYSAEIFCLFELLLSVLGQNTLNNYFDINNMGDLYVVFYTIEAMKKGTNAEQANFQSQHDYYKQQILSGNFLPQVTESINQMTIQNPEAPLKSFFLLNYSAMDKMNLSPEIVKFLETSFFTSIVNFFNRESPIALVFKEKYSDSQETFSVTTNYMNNVLHCSSSLIKLPEEEERVLKLVMLFFAEVIKEMEIILKDQIHWRFISKDSSSSLFNIPQTIWGSEDSKRVFDIAADTLEIDDVKTILEFMSHNFLHYLFKDVILRINGYIESKFIPKSAIRELEDKKLEEFSVMTEQLRSQLEEQNKIAQKKVN